MRRTHTTRFNRTTTPETLLKFTLDGEDYTIRQDIDNRGLFHRKWEWPSGARWWRPIEPTEWARMPDEAKRRILAFFGMQTWQETP